MDNFIEKNFETYKNVIVTVAEVMYTEIAPVCLMPIMNLL